jgi:hypothetical protein
MASTGTVTVLSGGKEGVDTKELRALTKAFHGWNPDKELKKALRVAGQLIADDAKAIVAPHSKSIPPTIKVRIAKTRISVVAGGVVGAAALARELQSASYGSSKAEAHRKQLERRAQGNAIAGLFELGNKGKGKSRVATKSGKFRHPVFGDRSVWVDQPMHPYLLRAAMMNERKIEHLEGEAVAEAFHKSGFKVS